MQSPSPSSRQQEQRPRHQHQLSVTSPHGTTLSRSIMIAPSEHHETEDAATPPSIESVPMAAVDACSWLSVNCPVAQQPPNSSSNQSPSSQHHVLDFGECTLDSIHTATVTVTNHSDLTTECGVKYTSAFHTVTVSPLHLTLPPRSSAPLTIQVQARQLNPNYHKFVTLINETNAQNTITIMVRSTNTNDCHGVHYHSQFYEVHNPYVGPPPGLPNGFHEVNGRIRVIEEEGSERRKGKESKGNKQEQLLSEDEMLQPNDDSDMPPLSTSASTETGENDHSNSTTHTHSSSNTPVPPISPHDHAANSGSLSHSNSNTNLNMYHQPIPIHHSNSGTNIASNITNSNFALSTPNQLSRATSEVPLYQLAYPHPSTNIIPLGTIVCQHPLVRMIEVRNVTRSRLVLRLNTSLDPDRPGSVSDIEEMKIYLRNDAMFQTPAERAEMEEKSKLLTPGTDASSSTPNNPTASPLLASSLSSFNPAFPSPPPAVAYRALLSPLPQTHVAPHVADSWSRFISTLSSGEQVALTSRLPDLASERSYVKKFILHRRDIDTVIKEQLILPIHEAQSPVDPNSDNAASSSPSSAPLLILDPLQTRQVFIYIHMHSQLPVRASPSIDDQQPPESPSASSFVTFLNKDFTKNKLIRLDEREIRQRDTQMNVPTSSEVAVAAAAASAALQVPEPIESSQPTSIVQAAVSAVSSPIHIAHETADPAMLNEMKALISAAAPSHTHTVDHSTLSEPGLKVFFQLVEYPAISDDDRTRDRFAHPVTPPSNNPAQPTQQQLPPCPSTLPIIRTSFPVLSPPPTRSLFFPAYLCRSSLEVAQKHINFGQLLNMNIHAKTLVLSNLSEVPLLFMVKQTGSIASLDLTFPKGDIGVIPACGYTDLPFLFKPSLAGKFLEPITILNVEDATNTRIINVKAYLRKPVHFWIQNLELDFKICCGGLLRQIQPIRQLPGSNPSSATHSHALRRSASFTSPSTSTTAHALTSPHPATSVFPTLFSSTPIVTSTQRIVVKNISLKARTFKIQMVFWEKRMVRALVAESRRPEPIVEVNETIGVDTEHDITPMNTLVSNASVMNDSPQIVTYYPDECPSSLALSCVPSLTLKLEDVALGASLSLFEREEEEEKLNHKLRIAIRKKKLDKIEKIRNRLSELRDMKMERQQNTQPSSTSNSTAVTSPTVSALNDKDPNTLSNKDYDSMEGLIFTLEPNAVQNVRATFTPIFQLPNSDGTNQTDSSSFSQGTNSTSFIEFYTGLIHVFETKNKEIIEEVKCSVAICSDVTTQEDYLQDPKKWQHVMEEEEQPDEQSADTEYDSAMEESSAGAQPSPPEDSASSLFRPAMIPSSPQSARPRPSSIDLPSEESLLFIRSKSLPVTDDVSRASLPSDTMLPMLSEPASLEPRPLIENVTTSPIRVSSSNIELSTPSLQPVIPIPGVHQMLISAPVSLPLSLLPVLQFPQSFPQYSSSKSSPAMIATTLRTQTNFFNMLYQQYSLSSGGQLSLPAPPTATNNAPIASSPRKSSMNESRAANTIAKTALPPVPFSTSVPLEFVSSTSIKSSLSRVLPQSSPRELMASRARSSPADRMLQHRTLPAKLPSNSASQGGSSSTAATSNSATPSHLIATPYRLMSGTNASIFRVYIEDQVPLSLPSPSFFTLNSHVPMPMILEIKWVPQLDSSDAINATLNNNRFPSMTNAGSLFGANSNQSQLLSKQAGGFMRVFVKPGTSLLTTPNNTSDAQGSLKSMSETMPRARTSIIANSHHLLTRGDYSHDSSARSSISTSGSISSLTSAPTPSASLFVYLPPQGELDVFMCWLATLVGITPASQSSGGSATKPRVKQLRRSSSSLSSNGGGGHSSTPSTSSNSSYHSMYDPDAGLTSSMSSNNLNAHRWKKGVSLIDPSIMQEAILLPSQDEEAESTVVPNSASDASDILREPPVTRHANPAMSATARARQNINRSGASTLSSYMSAGATPTIDTQPKLPRGQLLIRPVAFPHIRSTLGVEVCSVSGAATLTSPLMLTPERIHAGVVLVDINAFSEDADLVDINNSNAGSRRRSFSMAPGSRAPSPLPVPIVNMKRESGIVRGRFVIYNSMTSRSSSRVGGASAGKVVIVLGQQTKNTLSSAFVPPHHRAEFTFKPMRACIPPNDRRVIEFECQVRSLGHQTHGILVRDVTHDIDMVLPVTFTARIPTFLNFRDCKEGEFNVGLIYASKAATQLIAPETSSSSSTQTLLSPHATRISSTRSRFSKLVSFRLENPRDYAIRVEITCNLSSELHVYDGENDVDLQHCISCANGACSALTQSDTTQNPNHSRNSSAVDVAASNAAPSTPLRLNRTVSSRPRHLILHPRTVRTVLLAFTPVLSDAAYDDDYRRVFTAGLAFFVFIHRPPVNEVPPSPGSRLIMHNRSPSHNNTVAPARASHKSSVRFIPEELTEDVIEFDVDTEDEEPDDGSQSGGRSSDEEEEDGIGTVSGLSLLPASIPNDRLLAELHVRVKALLGVSAMKIEPQQASEPSPDLHTFSTIATRISTIDFFALQQQQSSVIPLTIAPLRYTIRLRNTSSILPLCYRIVPSSDYIIVSSPFNVLAPVAANSMDEEDESAVLIEIVVQLPQPGMYQDWVSIYVAQQPTPDYRHLPSPSNTVDCSSPHHANETPQPPSMDTVNDLLPVREELLHTIFLRSFVKDEIVSTDLPQLMVNSTPTQHQHLSLGSVVVALAAPNEIDKDVNAVLEGEAIPPPVIPTIPLAISHKTQRRALLDAILNPPSVMTPPNLLHDSLLLPQVSLSPLILPTPIRSNSKESSTESVVLPKNSPHLRHMQSGSNDVLLHPLEEIAAVETIVSSVVPIHRSFSILNTSKETQWIWMRSDAISQIQVKWATTAAGTNGGAAFDQPCSCDIVPENAFPPFLDFQGDGALPLRNSSTSDLRQLESASPGGIELRRVIRTNSDSMLESDPATPMTNPHLTINAHANSVASLLNEMASPLDSNVTTPALLQLHPMSDITAMQHRDTSFSFQRVTSFDATPTNEALLADQQAAYVLPPIESNGEISIEMHSPSCAFHERTGYETHPLIPQSLLLHSCCQSIYQLAPGQRVHAHVTFTLDAYRIEDASQAKLLRTVDGHVEWSSLLTIHTQPRSRIDANPSASGDASQVSAAIRITAELVLSRELEASQAAMQPPNDVLARSSPYLLSAFAPSGPVVFPSTPRITPQSRANSTNV